MGEPDFQARDQFVELIRHLAERGRLRDPRATLDRHPQRLGLDRYFALTILLAYFGNPFKGFEEFFPAPPSNARPLATS